MASAGGGGRLPALLDELVRAASAGPRLALHAAQALGGRAHRWPACTRAGEVVVIGGGFAGLAAPSPSRSAGTVNSRAPRLLGGRAASFPDAVSGETWTTAPLMIAGYEGP
jgi:hypothetical protein